MMDEEFKADHRADRHNSKFEQPSHAPNVTHIETV